ncbi:MAG: aminoglycoside phosphotransferase family protein [Desulfobulbaceae bacterium]|uniref:Phosphotransferase enzyme family protein n=2 Tax=Desulfofustis glycolicus TaxID=51195 RepID=A0A1M5UVJ4_9BACT|nr:aminoglycoside phosphotransferase family protein [Desulfobulbaceae bacterium]SHH66920.1 Phosphotransferase enzyme family protein [Desulfofustis glycolicus DSM 9705]
MIDIENHAQLLDFLVQSGLLGERSQPLCTTLHGGVSNRTVKISWADGSGWVAKQALEKLRVQADWFSDPKRIHIEAAGLRWLARLIGTTAVPSFVFESHEQRLLIMSAVPEPHQNYKELLLTGLPAPHHAAEFGTLLARLHDNAFAYREELSLEFADTTFFENLRIDPYYIYAGHHLPAAAPFLFRLIDGTRKRRLTLVHGDYSPKNILIHRDRLILLDHEVIHFGDPAFDVGFSMAHFLSKAHARVSLRHQFAALADTYWQSYCHQVAGRPWAVDLERWSINHTLGCLLARVAGKSILEYLSSSQKAAQRMAVQQLIDKPPATMTALIQQFTSRLSDYE